jgi:N-acetylneuraminic acid mutarotase
VVAAIQNGAIDVLGGPTLDTPALGVTDPTWRAAVYTVGPQDIARASPGVGILPDGKPLVFGGLSNGTAIAEATRYDYTGVDTFAVSSMHNARARLGFATDASNIVYAIGGVDATGTPLSSVEAYSTDDSGFWFTRAALPQALAGVAAVADTAGHIFTFGGAGTGGTLTSAVYEYTIATNSWSSAASLPFAVSDAAAVLGSNGLIYVLGGTTAGGTTAAVESYDPSLNSWNVEAPLPSPVSSAAVVSDALGRIEILGGYDATGAATAGVWISQKLNQPAAAPAFSSIPSTYTKTLLPYTYQVLTSANPQATYTLTTFPTGMTVNSFTGLVSWTPTSAQLGSFPVTVQASNAAGTQSQSFSLYVTKLTPTTPTGFMLVSATNSSITLSWNASTSSVPIASYTVYHVTTRGHSGRDGGITTVYTAVGSTTTTSLTLSNLLHGNAYYVVQAYDTSGLKSPYSALIIASPLPDTTPPVLALPANQNLTTTTGTGVTDAAAFTATASDPLPGPDPITISYLGNGYAISSSYVFPLGVTTVTVTAVDYSGNRATGTFTVTVLNAVGPTLVVPPNQVVEATSAAGATDAAAFNVTALGNNPTVTFTAGGNPITSSYVFPLGTTTVNVTATDSTGSVTVSFTVTIRDTTPPTLTVPQPQPLVVAATSAAGTTDAAAFTATATDAVTPNPTIAYLVTGTAVNSSYVFPIGYTSLVVTATDAAGNVGSAVVLVWVQDKTPPVLTLPPNQTVVAVSAAGATAPSAFTASATDDITANPTITYSVGANAIDSSYVFPIGDTTVTVVAVDAAGNSASGTVTVSVINNPLAPHLVVPANQVIEATSVAGATDAAAFTATATSPVSSPTIVYETGTTTLSSSYVFPFGATTVQVTATDSNGLTSYGTFTVTVQDTTPPALTVPDWLTVPAASAAGATVPTAFTATATDAVTANPTISYYTANGTLLSSSYVFPVGITVVYIYAADNAGNLSSASFAVTVDGSSLPTTVTWTSGISLPAARAAAAAYTLTTGTYVFGGTTGTADATTVLQGDGVSGWTANPISLNGGHVYSAVGETYNVGPLINDGDGNTYEYGSDLFIYGGANGSQASSGMVNYFPYEPQQQPGGTGDPTVQAPSMSVARSALAYVSDPLTGQLYAIGGRDQNNVALASVERFTDVANSGPPPVESWSTLAPLPQALYGASAFADGAGHIFVIGGDDSTGTPVATVYRYTIATDSWDNAAPLPQATNFMAGALAPNGSFYVAGGMTATGVTTAVWAYAPGTNTWTPQTALPAAVYGAAGAVDLSGNLEVIGGYNAQNVPVSTVFVGGYLAAPQPTRLVITQAPSAAITTTQTVTVNVAVEDAAGNVVPVSGSVNVILAGPDGSTTVDSTTLSFINGTASYSFDSGYYGGNPGAYTVHFAADPWTGAATSFLIGIGPALPQVTVTGGTFTYDGSAHAATAMASNGTTAVNGNFTLTYNSGTVPPTDVGTYAVTATFASSDPAYAGAIADGSITITPATPTLQLVGGTFGFDGTPHAATLADVGVDGLTPVAGIARITYDGSTAPPTAPGTYAVSATFVSTDPDYANATATTTLTITSVPIDHVAVMINASDVTAGQPFQVSVVAQDASNQTVTDYNGIIQLTSSDPLAPSPALDITVVHGVGQGLATLDTAGLQIITASDIVTPTITGVSAPITVNPAAASHLLVSVPATATMGDQISVTVTALDGFGNTATGYTGTVQLSSSDGTAGFVPSSYTFQPTDAGTYVFTATLNTPGPQTITAADTATASVAGTSPPITVGGVAVESVSLAPSGFTVTFNRPFDPSVLNLFDGGANRLGPPDVTLVGAHEGIGGGPGNVTNGSLVLNPSTNSFTYVYTYGVLPDDTYTLTVRGGTDAFKDLSGVPGNSFTTTFTTNFNTSSVGLVAPAFARGPGQTVNLAVPQTSPTVYYNGMPIQLSDGNNATTAGFTLTYNTALLNITGAKVDAGATLYPDAPAGSTFTRTSHTVASGIATDVFAFSTNSSATLGTGAGPVTLGELIASVPNTPGQTIYKAKQILHVSGVTVDGILPGTGADGLQVVAYLADASGDGTYAGNDASLVGRVAGGQDTGFAAYPLVDPVVIADAAGEGVVTATDASQVAQAGVHRHVPNLPPIPAGAQVLASSAPDPTLSIPANLQAGPDGTLSVPVNLDDPHPAGSTGLTEATLALSFDPAAFTVSARDVHLGSIPAAGQGWTLTSTVDAVTGQIGITLYSLTPITSNQAGSLVTIAFHASPGAVDARSIQLVGSVDPNGQGSYVTSVADTNGAMILAIAPGGGPSPAPPATVEVAAPVSTVTLETKAAEAAPANSELDVAVLPAPPEVESSGEDAAAAENISAPARGTVLHQAAIAVNRLLSQAAQAATEVFPFVTSVPAVTPPGTQRSADRLFLAVARGTMDLADLAFGWGGGQDATKEHLTSQLPIADWEGIPLGDLHIALPDLSSDLGTPPVAGRRAPATAPAEVTDTVLLNEYFARMSAEDVDDAPGAD